MRAREPGLVRIARAVKPACLARNLRPLRGLREVSMNDLAMRRLAIAFAATLAACGGGNGPTSTLTGSPVAAPPPPSAAPPPGPTPAPSPSPVPPPPAMPPPVSGTPTIVHFSAAASGVAPALVGGSIQLARDNNLWFNAGFTSDQIGRMTPDGVVSYPVTGAAGLGSVRTGPLATGADGNLWFADPVGGTMLSGAIGTIDVTTAVAKEFSTPLLQTTTQLRVSTAQDQSCTAGICTPVPTGSCIGVAATPTAPATTCKTATTGPTLTDACMTTPPGVANSYTTTTCTPTINGPAPVTTCTTTPPTMANSFVRITCTGITPGAQALAVASGPDGKLWFTEFVAPRLGVFDPATKIATEFGPLQGPATSIAAGPDGNVWFAESLDPKALPVIGRITPAGVITEFTAGLEAGQSIGGITAGSDGFVWFLKSGTGGAAIGKINPSTGSITLFASGFSGTFPLFGGITVGPDGNMWFTDYFSGLIGRIATDGTIGEFGTIALGSQINAITAGPLVGGAKTIWFTEPTTGQIGRATLP